MFVKAGDAPAQHAHPTRLGRTPFRRSIGRCTLVIVRSVRSRTPTSTHVAAATSSRDARVGDEPLADAAARADRLSGSRGGTMSNETWRFARRVKMVAMASTVCALSVLSWVLAGLSVAALSFAAGVITGVVAWRITTPRNPQA